MKTKFITLKRKLVLASIAANLICAGIFAAQYEAITHDVAQCRADLHVGNLAEATSPKTALLVMDQQEAKIMREAQEKLQAHNLSRDPTIVNAATPLPARKPPVPGKG